MTCAGHKLCDAGEGTEAPGDATTDTKCTACSVGRFRAEAPTDNLQPEVEDDVCVAHKICKAGEWTKTTGSAVSYTTCVACKADTFREKGPTDTVAAVETQVCKPHKICSP